MLIDIFLVLSSFWCIFESLQKVVNYISYQSVKWILNLSILAHFGKDIYEACFSDIIPGINVAENSISYMCCQNDIYESTLSATNTLLCNTVPGSQDANIWFRTKLSSGLKWCVEYFYIWGKQTFSFCCFCLLFFRFVQYISFSYFNAISK